MKCCVSSDCLYSIIDLGFIPKVEYYYSVSENDLREYLNSKEVVCKDVVTRYA